MWPTSGVQPVTDGVEAAEDDVVVFLRADEGGGRAVRVVGADEAERHAARLETALTFLATFRRRRWRSLATAGQGDGAEHGAGEVLQEVDREVGGFLFVGGFLSPSQAQTRARPASFMLCCMERVLQTGRSAARASIWSSRGRSGDFEHHRLDAGEACLGGDLDHVVEFVVVAFAGALHEPGIDFGAELNSSLLFSWLF
jgi:hypothetical protein